MSDVLFLVDDVSTEAVLLDWEHAVVRMPPERSALTGDDADDQHAQNVGACLDSCLECQWLVILPSNHYTSIKKAWYFDLTLRESHMGSVVRMYPFWDDQPDCGMGIPGTMEHDAFLDVVRARMNAAVEDVSYKWLTIPQGMVCPTEITDKQAYREYRKQLDAVYMHVLDSGVTGEYFRDVWTDERYFQTAIQSEVGCALLYNATPRKLGFGKEFMDIQLQGKGLPVHF